MLVKKEVEIPARKESRIVSVICDMCGKEHNAWSSGDKIEWGSPHDIKDTCVSITEGYSCSDMGNHKILSAHICMKCFKTKLIPWLESQGVKMTESEVDW